MGWTLPGTGYSPLDDDVDDGLGPVLGNPARHSLGLLKFPHTKRPQTPKGTDSTTAIGVANAVQTSSNLVASTTQTNLTTYAHATIKEVFQ
jgi:hypothetical protein